MQILLMQSAQEKNLHDGRKCEKRQQDQEHNSKVQVLNSQH